MSEKIRRDEEGLILHTHLPAKRALLVSVYQGPAQKSICAEHLAELERLIETYGMVKVGAVPCNVRKFDASTFLGKGKLEELVELARSLEADLVVFDDEISPAQQRNLQEAFQVPVIDRTEVILGVFAQRARTKEARLQIELAKIRYEAPRLKRLWTHLSRQQGTGGAGGSGAYLKGEGEKQIEIDRRILKQKIEQLQAELAEVRAHRETQRLARNRSDIPVFALIGYTNAGKSTLMNALTDAGVLVEDKLFATLDTTTRKFTLQNRQEILLIDTVGFIRKLPHQLVEAFKSTLEEALQADILLHLVDVSHPMAEEQAATTCALLKELGAQNKPVITLMNKIDRCSDRGMSDRIRMCYPKNVAISALHRQGFEELEESLIRELSQGRQVVELRIPQSDYAAISEVMRQGTILKQEYEENAVYLRASLPLALAGKLVRYQFNKP